MLKKMGVVLVALVLGLPLTAQARPGAQVGCPVPGSMIRVDDVQPRQVAQAFDTVITVYGSGFIATSKVDMVGVGILPTEYLSDRLLRATVPSSRTPGDYRIVVREPATGDCSNIFERVTVTFPPAAPTVPVPTSPPTPGQPVLVIRNYALNPISVKPGEEFELAIDVYNTGSRGAENSLVTFPGGIVVPIGPSNGYLLGLVHINGTVSVRQRFRVPEAAPGGITEIKVAMSANDFEGKNYTFAGAVPFEIIGPKPTVVPPPGKPQVVIETSQIDPPNAALKPGDTFTVTMQIANRGSRAATGILVQVGSLDIVAPADGSNVTPVRGLNVGGTVEVYQPLTLLNKVDGGRKNLEVKIDYFDSTGTAYNSTQSVGISVAGGVTGTERPQLLMTGFKVEPQQVYIGQIVTLTLDVQNVGTTDANRATVTLGGETGASLKPFAPVGASNVRFFPTIAAGKSVQIVQQVISDGNAEAQSHNMEVVFGYEDERGVKLKESQIVSLQLRRKPVFKIAFSRPVGEATVNVPLTVVIDALNLGNRSVNVSTIEINGDDFELPVRTLYVGPINGGTIGSFETTLIPRKPGMLKLSTRVNYLDEFSQPQTIDEILDVEVLETQPVPTPDPNAPPAPGGGTEERDGPIVRFIKGLFGLGS